MTFLVLEIREKSILLTNSDNSVKFFIKKSWMRADGTFTPAVEKAYTEASESQKEKQDYKASKVVFNNFDWQSEKSVAIDVNIEFTASSSLGHTKKMRVFFPKSKIENGNKMPQSLFDWFVKQAFDKWLDEKTTQNTRYAYEIDDLTNPDNISIIV